MLIGMESVASEGYDTEEEFERELAAVNSATLGNDSDHDDGSTSWDRHSDNADTEDGSSDISSTGGDSSTLPSLAAFKRRLEERDSRLDDFTDSLTRIWDGIQQPSAQAGVSKLSEQPGASSSAPVYEEDSQICGPAEDATGIVDTADHKFSTTPVLATGLHGPDPNASIDPGGTGMPSELREGMGTVLEQREGISAGDTTFSAREERFQLWREQQASDQKRAAKREAARKTAEEQALAERLHREEEAAKLAEQLQHETAQRFAELEAAAAHEAARIEQELALEARAADAAKEAEQADFAARAAAEKELLRRATDRQRAREEAARAVAERQLVLARRNVAALKIWNCWKL